MTWLFLLFNIDCDPHTPPDCPNLVLGHTDLDNSAITRIDIKTFTELPDPIQLPVCHPSGVFHTSI